LFEINIKKQDLKLFEISTIGPQKSHIGRSLIFTSCRTMRKASCTTVSNWSWETKHISPHFTRYEEAKTNNHSTQKRKARLVLRLFDN